MAITRIGLIALADGPAQDEAVKRFSNFVNDCKKASHIIRLPPIMSMLRRHVLLTLCFIRER